MADTPHPPLAERTIQPPAMDRTMTIVCGSEAETHRCGRALGSAAEPGLVIALTGNLGAGKTRLVQAAAEALGVEPGEVTSPTFVLIHEYAASIPIYHFDTYRLRDRDEFLELGADEYMHSDGVCFIEWAERMAEVLPRDLLKIEIAITGETTREWKVTATGARSQRVIERLHAIEVARMEKP